MAEKLMVVKIPAPAYCVWRTWNKDTLRFQCTYPLEQTDFTCGVDIDEPGEFPAHCMLTVPEPDRIDFPVGSPKLKQRLTFFLG